jgi:hypothetical protein
MPEKPTSFDTRGLKFLKLRDWVSVWLQPVGGIHFKAIAAGI